MKNRCHSHTRRFAGSRSLPFFALLLFCGLLGVFAAAPRADDGSCGVWEHVGWVAGIVTWTADTNGNPQASISDATEHCGWSDPCEGTTKENQTHSVAYTLISDQIVADGNGYKRQYTWRADAVCANGTPLWTTASHPLPRSWEPAPAIEGGEIDGDETREVEAGEELTVSVNQATDKDTWHMFGNRTGQANDTVNYKWTADGGSFNGSTTSRTAKWQAPEQGGIYTLTCTIDDEPAAVNAPDTGSRDDEPIVRTITVRVIERSEAVLRLFKDAALTQEITGGDKVGGNVQIVLQLKIGGGESLASSSVTLRVEEDYAEHSEAERRWDTVWNLASGWQISSDGENWTDAGGASPQNAGGGRMYWRKVLGWNTASQPLGHNANHSVSLVAVDSDVNKTELEFTPIQGTPYPSGPGSKNVDVQNVVLSGVTTSAGNPDYFKFDPSSNDTSMAEPTVTFAIEDEGDPNRYKWKVRIRSTDIDNDWTNSILISGIKDGPDAVTAKINDPTAVDQTQVSDMSGSPANDPTAYAPLMEWGTYTFDISIEEVDAEGTSMGDSQSYRSQKLRFPYLRPDGTARGHGGDMITDANGVEHYYVHYFFRDVSGPALPTGTEVSSMKIEMLSPNLETIASNSGSWGKKLETVYEDKLLKTFDPEPRQPGVYITIFMAEDTHAKEYRDHENKRVLAKNDRQGLGECEVIEVTPGSTTKVLISAIHRAKHGGNYPNAAQTKDAEITITAKVQNAVKGQTVYFEVSDPRDASSYNQSQALNDNRDSDKSGAQGYTSFQNSCLASRQVKIGSTGTSQEADGVWKVTTTLRITDRYAGDNYQVRATGRKPADMTKPFDQQPTDWGGSYQASGLMVAWRRIYLEIDQMFTKGATLLNFYQNSNSNPDVLHVDNTGDFNIGDQVVIWHRDQFEIESEITAKTDTTITVTDVGCNLPNFTGIRLKNDTETFGTISRSFLTNAYGGSADGSDGGTFIEFQEVQGWTVPKYHAFPAGGLNATTPGFLIRWFKNNLDRRNFFQLLPSRQIIGFGGIAYPNDNTSTVADENVAETAKPTVVAHEIGHLLDLMNPKNGGVIQHADEPVNKRNHDDSDECVMTYNENRHDEHVELDLECLYHVRDFKEPF